MARYEYHCADCNTSFTVELSMADKLSGAGDKVSCPRCSALATQVFNAAGVVFKGSGFFNTDRRTHAGVCGEKSCDSHAGDQRRDVETTTCPAAGSKPACSGCAQTSD